MKVVYLIRIAQSYTTLQMNNHRFECITKNLFCFHLCLSCSVKKKSRTHENEKSNTAKCAQGAVYGEIIEKKVLSCYLFIIESRLEGIILHSI